MGSEQRILISTVLIFGIGEARHIKFCVLIDIVEY